MVPIRDRLPEMRATEPGSGAQRANRLHSRLAVPSLDPAEDGAPPRQAGSWPNRVPSAIGTMDRQPRVGSTSPLSERELSRPTPPGEAAVRSGSANAAGDGAPVRTVLVVDDDAALSNLLKTILTGEGYAVRTATDGLEALAIIEREPPDVLLADVWMPRMSGYELVDRMIGRGDRIAVVLMSGIVPESRFPRLRFLRKPFGIAEVIGAVRTALAEPIL